MYHPMWEPIWQAINEVELPLHFHTFPVMSPQDTIENRVRSQVPAPSRSSPSCQGFQMNLINIVAAVIGGATSWSAIRTYAMAFGESGIGWLPYALDRMDFEWEDRFHRPGADDEAKSDYWRRQCKATFQYDNIGVKLVDDMGAESLMWGSDYPHGDGVWPESDKYIAEQFAELPAAQTKMITCDNAAKFYRLVN